MASVIFDQRDRSDALVLPPRRMPDADAFRLPDTRADLLSSLSDQDFLNAGTFAWCVVDNNNGDEVSGLTGQEVTGRSVHGGSIFDSLAPELLRFAVTGTPLHGGAVFAPSQPTPPSPSGTATKRF